MISGQIIGVSNFQPYSEIVFCEQLLPYLHADRVQTKRHMAPVERLYTTGGLPAESGYNHQCFPLSGTSGELEGGRIVVRKSQRAEL